MLDELMGSPVVALGTNRPVQLKGVGMEAAKTKPEITIVQKNFFLWRLFSKMYKHTVSTVSSELVDNRGV